MSAHENLKQTRLTPQEGYVSYCCKKGGYNHNHCSSLKCSCPCHKSGH